MNTALSEAILNQLVKNKYIAEEDLFLLAAESSNFEEVRRSLVEQQLTTEANIAKAVAEVYNLAFVDLSAYPVDPAAVSMVPASVCQQYQVLPIAVDEFRLTVAMVDPGNSLALEDLHTATGLVISPVVSAKDDVLLALGRYLFGSDDIEQQLARSLSSRQVLHVNSYEDEDGDLVVADSDPSSITKFVNNLISQVIQDRATDLHLEPKADGLRIRSRIDGVLHDRRMVELNSVDGIVARLKLMAGVNVSMRTHPQEGKFTALVGRQKINFRLFTVPTVAGEKLVLRLDEAKPKIFAIDNLELSASNLNRLWRGYQRSSGLVLVAGPKSSGKTSTIYSILNDLARPTIDIVTISEKVECELPTANQIQLGSTKPDYRGALKTAEIADADVIALGALPDAAAANQAINAALSGKLVLVEVAAQSAVDAVFRFIEFGADRYLLASALNSVVAQRLARRLCDSCKESYQEEPGVLEALGLEQKLPEIIYRANGCATCANTGYSGRIPIQEILSVTPDQYNQLIHGAEATALEQTAVDQGMVQLRDDGWKKVANGSTTIEEILRVVSL